MGETILDTTKGAFENIVDKIQNVATLTNEITRSIEDQVKGIEHVDQGMRQIDNVIQKNSGFAEQNKAQSIALVESAKHFENIVSFFEVNGDNSSKKT